MFLLKNNFVSTPNRRQSKTLFTMAERGPEIATTSVSIAICRQSGNYWLSKTLFLTIFGLRSSIVLTFSIAAYPVWFRCTLHDVTVDISACN